MPISPTSAPTNLAEIGTNLGVLIIALGAALAGIMKGIRDTRKLLRGDEPNAQRTDDRKQVLAAAIIETITIQQWTEQNRAGVEHTRVLCVRLEEMIEELRDSRSVSRDFIDEVRKLRMAVSDLNDTMRR